MRFIVYLDLLMFDYSFKLVEKLKYESEIH